MDSLLPFTIRRVFYIYGVDQSVRGGHRHHSTVQACICLQGSCQVRVHDGRRQETFLLNQPDHCLLLYPQDWHSMEGFTPDAIFLVLASEAYDPDDYIHEPYP